MKSRKAVNSEKVAFWDALARWKVTSEGQDWNTMFLIVNDICLSLCKNKANGIVIRDLESKALDAAILSMDLIKRGKYPKTGLIAWCGYQVTRVLYNQHQPEVDREYSFNDLDENIEESMDDAEEQYLEKLCPLQASYKNITGTDYYIKGEYNEQ